MSTGFIFPFTEKAPDSVGVVLKREDAAAIRPSHEADPIHLEVWMVQVGVPQHPDPQHFRLFVLVSAQKMLQGADSSTGRCHDSRQHVNINATALPTIGVCNCATQSTKRKQ